MAKITFHDFGSIHDALNDLIVTEVKAALELLPEKSMESEKRIPLCRIVVSDGGDYLPNDMEVRRVWIDDDGDLCFSEYESKYESDCNWNERDDLLDISDFKYLIEQIAEKVEDGHHVLPNKAFTICGFSPELALIHESTKLITV